MQDELFEYFKSKRGKSLDVSSYKKDIYVLLKGVMEADDVLNMRFSYNKEYVDIGVMIDSKGFIQLSTPKGFTRTGIVKSGSVESFASHLKMCLRVWAEDIPDIEEEMGLMWKDNTIDEALDMNWKGDE